MAVNNEVASTSVNAGSSLGWKLLSITRIALGFYFLWPFFDKLIGLGFSTCKDGETGAIEVMCERAWLSGGAVTKGYLGSSTGPLSDFYIGLADQRWTDWVFMIGLLGIGLALMLGIGTKVAAWTAPLMLLMMYTSHLWPSTNPFLDDHIIMGLAIPAIVLVELQRQDIGLGKWWRSLGVVQKNSWLV